MAAGDAGAGGKPSARDPAARGPLGRALDGIDRLSDWGGWASAACIVAILALIVSEIAARNLFNYSIDFAWEFSAYIMGGAFMLGAAYSLRAGAQIRVNVLRDNLPRAAKRALDLLATTVMLVIAGYLAWALIQQTSLSFERGSRSAMKSELPLWIAQAPLAVGAALLTLQSLARALRILRGEPEEDEKLKLGQDVEAETS